MILTHMVIFSFFNGAGTAHAPTAVVGMPTLSIYIGIRMAVLLTLGVLVK